MQKKRGFLGGLQRYLDIPQAAFPDGFELLLSGKKRLSLQGCRRILTSEKSRIRLLLGKRQILVIEGEQLLFTVFQAGSLTVEGDILALRFEKSGESENA